MAKADVTALVSTLTLSDADATEVSRHYDDIVRELAYREVLTSSATIAVTAGTATYTVPANTIQLLEVHGQGGVIDRSSRAGIQSALGIQWRDLKGNPATFFAELESEDDITLVPEPDDSDTLTVIRTDYRADVPFWLELAIALEIIYREYSRESDHQDITFAEDARKLGAILFAMVGVPRAPKARERR